jgi:hypothetical protein
LDDSREEEYRGINLITSARKRMSMVSKNTENNTGVGGAGLMRAGKQSRLTIGNPKDLRKCKGE